MNEINPLEEIIDKDEEARIWLEIQKIDGMNEYLRALLARDMRLHFAAKKEDQDLIRGAYFRTEYLLKKLRDADLTNSK